MRVPGVRISTLVALGLCALTGLAALTLLRLDASPRLLPTHWGDHPGALPPINPGVEAALVVDQAVIRQAAARGTYPLRDSSAAWWNWLSQSLGPAGTLTPEALSSDRLKALRLLVITRSASSPVTQAQLEAVRQLTLRGGAVVLEMPGSGWAPLAGVELTGDDRAGGRLTRAAFPLPGASSQLLRSIELPTRHRRTTLQAPDVTPVLWLDDVPVAFLRRLEQGVVVTLAIDLGHLWQTLQQGRPDDDLRVRNRYLEAGQLLPLETNDLVSDPALLTAEVPLADLLEDGLFRLIATEVGLPSWWLYPDGAPGAFLMSHDEEGMGARAAWMAEEEAAWQCPSTNFLVPSPALSSPDIARYARAGAAVALHYVLPAPDGQDYPGSGYDTAGRFETFGLWKIQPVRRLLSPAEQWAWLQARAGDVPVTRATRTHFLAWTGEYTGLFQALAAAGMTIDSSYGPDLKNRGYLFGTARPFRPLGADGMPLPIFELPFVAAEDLGGADRAFLFRLLEESATTTHQALSVLYHPNSFRWHPSVANYQTWKEICRHARSLGHWVTTFGELEAFQRRREAGTLSSSPIAQAPRLKVAWSFPGGGGTVALPSSWRERRLVRVTDGMGQAQTPQELTRAGLHLVRVQGEQGVLEATYEAATDPGPGR